MAPETEPVKDSTPRLTPSQQMGKYFNWEHLQRNDLQRTSQQFQVLYNWIETNLPDGPEKTTAVRKLLEAKDCAVRTLL